MSESMLAIIAILISAFFWSTAGTATKILFRTADPFPVAFLRFFLASLILLPIVIRRGMPNIRQTIKQILPIAVFLVLNIVFFYIGLNKTTADASLIIYATSPLFVSVLAQLFLNEKVTRRKLIGLFLGLIGVVTVIILPLVESGAVFVGDTTGNIITLFGVLAWSLYAVSSKKLSAHYPPLTISAYSIFASCMAFFILTLIFPHRPINETVLRPQFLLLITYLAFFVTIVTFLLYQWSVKHTTATIASLTNYAQPVFGVIINGFFLGEKLTFAMAIGAILTIGGVILATSGSKIPEKQDKNV